MLSLRRLQRPLLGAVGSSAAVACPHHQQSQIRRIRIQEPDPDIKTYWRKETEQIRQKNEGVPLGSSHVQGEAFEEYIKLATANGNVADSKKLAKWVLGVIFIAFILPTFVGESTEEPGASYTPYEKKRAEEIASSPASSSDVVTTSATEAATKQ